MTVYVGVQEKPADHRGGEPLAWRELTEHAETYGQAMAAVHAQVPVGWRAIYTRVDRDGA